ncbi:cysteine dioxygenase family protein [Trinickia sp. LjRoot230]|uniref:cysteine dioxygenase n=1 Tax=Trinickia sp. LjRoot230 TaxID=3342288 RepID=UPI003ECEA00A
MQSNPESSLFKSVHAPLERRFTTDADADARLARPTPTADAIRQFTDALDAAYEAVAGVSRDQTAQQAEFARRVRAALVQAAANPELLGPAQREGAHDSYCRHLIAADPRGRYALVSLVWRPGQTSPVHGHRTWCGYAVVDGVLTETLYEWSDAHACALPVRTHAREPGAVSYVRAGRTAIHRLSNTAAGPAVSLHLYGVPGERIATHVNDLVDVAA